MWNPILSFTVLAALCVPFAAPASETGAPTPAGRWRTYDEKTAAEKSIVTIVSHDGVLSGSIEKVLEEQPDGKPPICEKCPGERANQPVEGMQILQDVKHEGKSWGGGTILDPENGKTYNVTMKLLPGGAQMEVRGYIGGRVFGFAPLGRTQVWDRSE